MSDIIWRNVEEDSDLLEKYPDEEVVILTDICTRLGRAREILFERGEWRMVTACEKAIKFAFIGGYK